MRLSVRRLWNGVETAPVGGDVTVDCGDSLVLRWDLALPASPRAPREEPGFLDGLWGYDVVELFVTSSSASGRPRYVEIEAGPSRHWLALAFDGVRRRSAELRDLAPRVASSVDGTRWIGELEAPLDAIVKHAGPPPWRGLACLVCGGAEGTERRYLTSAPLPGEAPDFHQPAAWPRLTPGPGGASG